MARAADRNGGAARSVSVWHMAFMLIVLLLVLLGLVMVYSASSISTIADDEASYSDILKQAAFVVVGVVLSFLMYKLVPMNSLREGTLPMLVWTICVVLIVLTAVIGTVALGAQRWVNIGPFSFQPSEFLKIAVVIMAARVFCEWRQGRYDLKQLIQQVAIFVGIPVAMVFVLQSDMGTAMIICMGVLAAMLMSEVPWPILLALCVIAVLLVAATALGSDYRSERWAYLDPYNDGYDGYGAGYQIIHSYYAFAEGGITGLGLGNSREKYLYLSEQQTDFIFAIIGEELGLIGSVAVILLFMALLVCGLMIAKNSLDAFSGVLAGSLTMLLVAQAFVNIGCVIGVLPTTGKPLPFISYGGSSMWSSLFTATLVLMVSKEAATTDRYQQRREHLTFVSAAPAAPSGTRTRSRDTYRAMKSQVSGRDARFHITRQRS